MMMKLLAPPEVGCKASIGLLLVRIVVGAAFMFHGWGKIQKPFTWMGEQSWAPGFLQGLAALSEFGGGAALILGLLVPLASLGIAFTMAVATYTHMVVKGDPFVGKPASWELASVFLSISILLFLIGPGKLSLDALLFSKKNPTST